MKDGCSLSDLATVSIKCFVLAWCFEATQYLPEAFQRGAVAVVWLEATFTHFNFPPLKTVFPLFLHMDTHFPFS